MIHDSVIPISIFINAMMTRGPGNNFGQKDVKKHRIAPSSAMLDEWNDGMIVENIRLGIVTFMMTCPIPIDAMADNKPAFVIPNPHATHKNMRISGWTEIQSKFPKTMLPMIG